MKNDVESLVPPARPGLATRRNMARLGLALLLVVGTAHVGFALPTAFPVFSRASMTKGVYDIQGHRGSRGATVESTLPAFAWYVVFLGCMLCGLSEVFDAGG
ncbi:hypothetical protein FS749_014122 [Ceratobasidium sp. UAMH 11750]|nr:hypothetical protein FS749_014122 [Ceratobasidium sp. UAMH 11750]